MPPKPRKPPPRPPRAGNHNLLIAVGAAAAVVIVLVAASLAFRGGGDDAAPSEATTPGGSSAAFLDGIPQDSVVLGRPSAKVTMIQFEDLQCPICKRYTQDAFPAIVEEYVRTGKVKIRFAGISFIGPDSEKALRFVIAAGKQGKLWQLNDVLYSRQGDENSGWFTTDLVRSVAVELGLDFAKLEADAKSAGTTQLMSSMSAESEQRQVGGTPWFFVQAGDGDPYHISPSALTVDAFRPILDDALRG